MAKPTPKTAVKGVWGQFNPYSSQERKLATAFHYLQTLAICGFALLITLELWNVLQPTPSPVFLVAIVLSSWFGGIGPGLLASLLSTLLVDYCFEAPFFSFGLSRVDIVRFVTFSIVALLVSRIDKSRRKDRAIIETQNAYTELLLETAAVLNQATPVKALQACVEKISILAGWSVGYGFLLSDDGLKLLRSECWYLTDKDRFAAFVSATQAQDITEKHSLAQSVITRRNPVWVSDINANGLFARRGHAVEAGLTTGLACPVLRGSEVIGILEFFSVEPRESDPKLVAVISLVGNQLGRVVKNEEGELS